MGISKKVKEIVVQNGKQEFKFERFENTNKFFNPVKANFVEEEEMEVIINNYKEFEFHVMFFEEDHSIEAKLENSSFVDFEMPLDDLIQNSYWINIVKMREDGVAEQVGCFTKSKTDGFWWTYEICENDTKYKINKAMVKGFIDDWSKNQNYTYAFYDKQMNII